jgi:SAM-dependent methyltransferase
VRQAEWTPYVPALRTARLAAYPQGESVEQEGFMRASEILSIARRAGVGPGVSLLDLCCGEAGPGRLITSRLGCTYRGIDMSAAAIRLARAHARGLPCRFEVGEVPPVPGRSFDVVLLLETMLAFPDKDTLLREISTALAPGGRFAFTVEEGEPLTVAERQEMPGADTVWPIPLTELISRLSDVGLEVRWMRECTHSHRLVAEALHGSFMAERSGITAELGISPTADLLSAHRLWSDWMTTGRIRKFEIVAEKTYGGRADSEPRRGRIRSGR